VKRLQLSICSDRNLIWYNYKKMNGESDFALHNSSAVSVMQLTLGIKMIDCGRRDISVSL
jgi:hypothetical protein